jgi:predicted transposase/invertase (TIGR01784 family)
MENKSLEKSVIETAMFEGERRGIKKGKAEGKLEGEKQAKIEIAKNLIDILDIETIAQKTGLTIEEIKNIIKS